MTISPHHCRAVIQVGRHVLYTRIMPRVEYTLSFENYLEMTQRRRRAPRFRAASISAGFGLGLILVGYTYLHFLPDAWPAPGLSCLGLGLLATFLAMPLAFFAKRREFRPDTATLRSEYHRFHADQRAIEFDEQGWRVFWYEGQDVRPWSCLRGVHDQKTLFVLSTQTTHYWLPKADLERDGQLEHFKTLAQTALGTHERLFAVQLRPSVSAYVAAWVVENWRRKYKGMLLGYAALTLFFYWMFFSERRSEAYSSPWWLGLAPVILFVLEVLYYLRNYYFAKWADAAPEAEIMRDCVSYKTSTIKWIAAYRSMQGFSEFPWGFHLYFDVKNFHLIPKKGFSQDQLLQFRRLISEDP